MSVVCFHGNVDEIGQLMLEGNGVDGVVDISVSHARVVLKVMQRFGV